MNKFIAIIAIALFSTLAFSQQKEKVKGSKIVTVVQKEIAEFESLEVSDNLEIFLIKGDKCSLEMEADDNVQQFIEYSSKGKTLQLFTSRQISGTKKLSVRVTFTDDFNLLIAKDDVNITALAELNLPNFTFKIHDNAKLFANANVKNFTLMMDHKSRAELNLKSEEATIEMSKNSQLKALIAATQMKFDMYQKSKAVIEGDVINFKLRLDNDADFTGQKLTAKNTDLLTEGFAECSINVSARLVLDAKGKTDTKLYGTQKIEVKNFLDSATLSKKTLK
ncbi:MAG: DUF2807 domain-containing protein [Flavobacterium sp.]|nr:DUF2807 domain-containing protein [Flavobacterium sp.]